MPKHGMRTTIIERWSFKAGPIIQHQIQNIQLKVTKDDLTAAVG